MFLQTEVLKQLSSMGRLVVCAGDGAVQSLTNLYVLFISPVVSLPFRKHTHPAQTFLKFSSVCSRLTVSILNSALLRHGISIWIDVPLEIAAKGDDPFSSEPSPEVFLLSFFLSDLLKVSVGVVLQRKLCFHDGSSCMRH